MGLNPLGSTSSTSADLYVANSSTQDNAVKQGGVASNASAAQSGNGALTSSHQVVSLLSRQTGDSTGDPGDNAGIASLLGIATSYLENSMEAQHLVSPAGFAQASISFDDVGYSVSSNVAVTVNQQGSQVDTDQYESQFVGMGGGGKITLADGKVYDFDISIGSGQQTEVSESQTLNSLPTSSAALAVTTTISNDTQASSADTTTDDNGVAGAASVSSAPSASSTTSTNYLAQMVEAMSQTGTPSIINYPGSSYQVVDVQIAPQDNSGQSVPTSQVTEAPAKPAAIDWDTIQQQTATLIDLLNAMTSGDQGASAATSSIGPSGGGASDGGTSGSGTTDGISKAVGKLMSKVITASETNATPTNASAAIADTTA
jgi:hypothetical protein